MLIVKEHLSPNYSSRTYYNAKSAEITLAFAMDFTTAGKRLTKKASEEEPNSEWHQACFSGFFYYGEELGRRGLKVKY